MYDKTKVFLFILTLFLGVSFFCSMGYFLYENSQLKETIEKQEVKQISAISQKDQLETTIVAFYRILYTYQDSAENIDLETLNQMTDPTVYATIKQEIEAAQQSTPQQNVIRSSMIQAKEIGIVPFTKSANHQLSYLVSIPILQKINGEETQFVQTEILSFDSQTKKIVQRQII
ncbi:hypothetical protein ACNZ61_002819 [Enterococcus hirae]